MDILRMCIPGVHPSTRTIESMVHLYGNKIYKLAYHMTGSSDDAEELFAGSSHRVSPIRLKLHHQTVRSG